MSGSSRLTDSPRPARRQVAELADGRWLVREPDGVKLLGGVAREDLVPAREPIATDRPGVDPRRVLLLGNGALGDRLGELLGVAASPAAGDLEALPRVCEVVVCALEEVAYGTLFEIQRACLRLGTVSLYLTVDPDGIRIGPAAVPGAGPCFACAQGASFRALGLRGAEIVAAVAGFQTGAVGPAHLEPAARRAAREVRALLAPASRPELLASVRLLAASARFQYGVMPALDCPLCGPARAAAAARPLVFAVERELAGRYRLAPRSAAAGGGDFCASVGIVGGGTAGYLTALALRRKLPGLEVTLIESSTVPVIGVGEATTPLMPQFLHVDLGLDIHELFREVAPTLKLGIRFSSWGAPEGAFNYPFGPVHVLEPTVYDGDLRRCSPRSLLIEAGTVPLARASGERGSDLGVDLAYHLDNRRFVAYLRRRAKDFGVRAADATISEVEVAPDGSVTGLVADGGRRFAFDLYVDCTGFRALLLEKAMGSPFLSYGDSLFTDRALIASVPYAGRSRQIRPYTLAETFDAGWCWSTPQRDADHRGYVFSSAFSSPEDAEREMRRAHPGMGDARLIAFRAGRHRHFWRGNVVAMGNAYGFVEPLESTALHMLIRQIGLFAGAFPIRRGERGVAAALNRKVGAWWDYLRWFLALHYRYNRSLDTPFWRHCRRRTDVSGHGELIELYRERGPLSYQGAALAGVDVPDPLWGAEGVDVLLLGQGVPARLPEPAVSRAEWQKRVALYQRLAEGTPQAEALEILDREPELLERWVAELERVGPAFGA